MSDTAFGPPMMNPTAGPCMLCLVLNSVAFFCEKKPDLRHKD